MESSELASSLRELKAQQDYLSELNKFNQSLIDGNNFFEQTTFLFQQWLEKLRQITKDIDGHFKSDADEPFNSNNYTELSSEIRKVLQSQIFSIIQDKTAFSSFEEIHSLLNWFLKVSLVYSDFHPIFNSGFNNDVKNVALHRFSDIIMELSEDMQTPPEDLALLKYIPSSFSHHLIAYSLLLCRLTAEEAELTQTEASLCAQIECDEIQRKYPQPIFLQSNPHFQKAATLYGILRDSVQELASKINVSLPNLSEAINNFKIVSDESEFGEFEKLWLQLKVDYNNLMHHTTSYYHNRTYSQIMDEIGYVSFLGESNNPVQQFFFLENKLLQPTNEFSIQNLYQILQQIPSVKVQLKEAIQRLHEHFIESETKRINFQRKEVNPDLAVTKERQEIENSIDTERQFVIITPCHLAVIKGELLPMMENLVQTQKILCSVDMLDRQTIIKPSNASLNGMINKFKKKMQKRKESLDLIYKKLTKIRNETDVLENLVHSRKNKLLHPGQGCRACEERPKYCLTTCGHTFCDNCLRQAQVSIWKCPYCGKDFENKDIIDINWN